MDNVVELDGTRDVRVRLLWRVPLDHPCRTVHGRHPQVHVIVANRLGHVQGEVARLGVDHVPGDLEPTRKAGVERDAECEDLEPSGNWLDHNHAAA